MLVRHNEGQGGWYPTSVATYEQLVGKVIKTGYGYKHVYALKKNLAYNLQYIEYLSQTLQDLKLSSVIHTQTYKTFIIVGSSIVESILHFLIIKRGLQKTSDWELEIIMPGNPKDLHGKRSKIDSHIYKKLDKPVELTMAYDDMLKKARDKKMLGIGHEVYNKLDKLRLLRNSIHLQAIDHNSDTDWNSFNFKEYQLMNEVLYAVLTSNIFKVSENEKERLNYLKVNFERRYLLDN